MRKVGMWLLVVVLMLSIAGCGNGGEAESEAGGKDLKQIEIVGRNATNVDWVIEKTTYGSQEYRGEMDAIYAEDFVVKAGEDFLKDSSTPEDYADVDYFQETSDTTYDFKIQLIAGGPMPTDPDEQYVYDPFSAVVDFVIKGTYGETAVVEWDGVAFKQVN